MCFQVRAFAYVMDLSSTPTSACGGKPESVTVVIANVEKEDWGTAGELMADKYPDK